ncbi:hypothetical protein [Hansschlegelia zhihuaiae]|uniref:Uncharacterized protein n=1 Tax=Hansschlegelia zhihuaiae TaxID=405005 RepID=A0A4Q0M4J4_9HYPH|nr:hypothetical protein [Hansschlegelia zhihuaiae]RXF67556.1 hypothetical protein EK403_21225 [Hansschlegelia zhihuaiae]
MTVDVERNVRELARAIATLEVVVTRLALAGFAGRPIVRNEIVGDLNRMADHALFERDGLDPVMLDRIVGRLARGHRPTP